MKKLQVKGNSKPRNKIENKKSPQMESASDSFDSDGEESEEDKEDSIGEAVGDPKNGTGAPKSADITFELDRVGHPEASPTHLFPTPPPDAGSKTTARKTTVISMILKAIEALDNKAGSSVQAIVKYIKSNGHEVTDERRFGRQVLRSLKLCITKGQVEQVKRSFRLTRIPMNRRRSVENLKAHKALEKTKVKEKKAQAKKQAKEPSNTAKAKEKPTKQPSKKKNPVKGNSGKAAAAQATIGMTNPTSPEIDVSSPASSSPTKLTAKNISKSDSKTKTKQNKPRKSIGTLAKPMAKPKVNVKAVKQLVAGKGKGKDLSELGDDLDAESNMLESQATPSPQMSGKATRKRK